MCAAADGSGAITGRRLYDGWGAERYAEGTLPTRYGFSGQYAQAAEFGWLWFRARWYDPGLGRWAVFDRAQPDTVVPGPYNPQDLDRYAYVRNNPLWYKDPSGHLVCSDKHVAGEDCSDEGAGLWRFKGVVTLSGYGWDDRYEGNSRQEAVRAGVVAVAIKLQKQPGGTLRDAFEQLHGKVNFTWGVEGARGECATITAGGCTTSAHQINFMSMAHSGGNKTAKMAATEARNNVVHELGYAFADLWYMKDGSYFPDGPYSSIPGKLLVEGGFHTSPDSARLTWRQHPGDTSPNEIFADMCLGWIFDTWATNNLGNDRADFMTTNMSEWIR